MVPLGRMMAGLARAVLSGLLAVAERELIRPKRNRPGRRDGLDPLVRTGTAWSGRRAAGGRRNDLCN